MPYLDTSVVAAYYVPEPNSVHAQAVYNEQSLLAISELVELELFSALSFRLRIGSLERSEVEQAPISSSAT